MTSDQAGFSLLELLLVLVLVGVLLAFALPAWQQHQLVASRQQAWLQLQRIGLQQEIWHLQHGVYFDDMALVTPAVETILYDYKIQISGGTYLLSAYAKGSGPQAYDALCQRLTLSADGELKSYGRSGETQACR